MSVLDLQGGSYVETGRVVGQDELAVQAPYPVALRPSALLG